MGVGAARKSGRNVSGSPFSPQLRSPAAAARHRPAAPSHSFCSLRQNRSKGGQRRGREVADVQGSAQHVEGLRGGPGLQGVASLGRCRVESGAVLAPAAGRRQVPAHLGLAGGRDCAAVESQLVCSGVGGDRHGRAPASQFGGEDEGSAGLPVLQETDDRAELHALASDELRRAVDRVHHPQPSARIGHLRARLGLLVFLGDHDRIGAVEVADRRHDQPLHCDVGLGEERPVGFDLDGQVGQPRPVVHEDRKQLGLKCGPER